MKELGRYSAWAFSAQQLLPRDTFNADTWEDCDSFLHQAISAKGIATARYKLSALIVGWYRHGPWSDEELAEELGKEEHYISDAPTGVELLENLGDAGRRVLEKFELQRSEKRAP
jgi:hypothetical protein